MTTMTMTPSLEPLPWCTLNRPLWIRNPVSQSMTRSVFFFQSCLPPLSESFHTRARCKISQFVISDGAWNCGRKSGVSKVNCEKLESIAVRTCACRTPAACARSIYSVRDCTTNDDSKRIASRRHWHD